MIHSNDPKQPRLKITLKAHINTPITLEPRGVLLHGFIDEDITGKVTIKAHEPQPLTLEPLKLSLKGKVSYELKTVKEGKEYEVIFRNLSKKRDKYSGFLKLKTSYANKPQISVMVFGYIKGSLHLRPETINFGQINQTKQMPLKSHQVVEVPFWRSVMITLNRGENFKIEKVDVNKEIFETKIQEMQEGKRYQLSLRLKAKKIPKGILKENIKVYTNVKDDAVIEIPISAQKM